MLPLYKTKSRKDTHETLNTSNTSTNGNTSGTAPRVPSRMLLQGTRGRYLAYTIYVGSY